jgi:hypothetical protein
MGNDKSVAHAHDQEKTGELRERANYESEGGRMNPLHQREQAGFYV